MDSLQYGLILYFVMGVYYPDTKAKNGSMLLP